MSLTDVDPASVIVIATQVFWQFDVANRSRGAVDFKVPKMERAFGGEVS